VFTGLNICGCGAGVVALSSAVEVALSEDKKNDTTTTTEEPPTTQNGSTLSTEITSTSTQLPTTTTVSPPKDIWTVKYPDSDRLCILLSANITLTYNDTKEVMNESEFCCC